MSANENGPRSAAQTGGQEGGDPERSETQDMGSARAAADLFVVAGRPVSTPTGPEVNGEAIERVYTDAPADIMSGHLAAVVGGMDRDMPLDKYLSKSGMDWLRQYYDKRNQDIPETLDAASIVMRGWFKGGCLPPDRPTLQEQADHADEHGYRPPGDLHAQWNRTRAARLERQRAARRADRETVEAITAAGVDPAVEFAPAEIERVHGGKDWAALALRQWVDYNAAGRGQGTRVDYPLTMTAAALVRCGATPGELAQMAPVSLATRADAARRLATAQRKDALRANADAAAELQREQWAALMGSVETNPFITVTDALALPPRESLWGSMIRRGSVYELLGPPGSGKTFLAADLCAAMATGQTRYLGEPLVPGNSVVIEAEGADILGVRLTAAAIKYGTPPVALADKIVMTPHALNLADPAHIALIVSAVERAGASLVVIDTRARNTIGIEENSATQMGPVYEHLAAVARRTRAAVLVIHHLNKTTRTSRGSGAASGAVDGELIVEETTYAITPAEGGSVPLHRVSMGKARLSKGGRAFWFRLHGFTVPREYFPPGPAYDAEDTRDVAQVLAVDPMDLPAEISATAEERKAERAAEAVRATSARDAAVAPLILAEVCAAVLGNRPLSASLGNAAGKRATEAVAASASASVGERVPASAVGAVAEALTKAGYLVVASFKDLAKDRRGAGQTSGEYLRPAEVYPLRPGGAVTISAAEWNTVALPALEHLGVTAQPAGEGVAQPCDGPGLGFAAPSGQGVISG